MLQKTESKLEKTTKNINELEKNSRFKKFHGDIDSVDYEDLDSYDYNYDFADDDKYRKIGSIRILFKELDRDYYKPIRTNSGFAERNDNYKEYTSNADRYENLSPKGYLNVIRPYLRDLIDKHKPITESNTTNNNINSNNNNSNNRTERKIQLMIKNNFISVKDFEDTCTIYSTSKL